MTARCLKILHLPLNTPYAAKLAAPPRFEIANGSPLAGGGCLPRLLTFEWICRRRDEASFWRSFDVLHVHFGFEFEPFERLAEALHACRRRGKRIVYTCHDLESVHEVGADHYHRCWRLLVTQADCVVTLTSSSRSALLATLDPEVGRGLDVRVVPHGYVYPPGAVSWPGGAAREARLGALGAPRKNRALFEVLPALGRRCLDPGVAVLRLLVKSAPLLAQPAGYPGWPEIVGALGALPGVEAVFRPAFEDEEIIRILGSGDVLLLAYSSGTHSGQLEMALDLGLVPVVADVGFLREQYDVAPAASKLPAYFTDAPKPGRGLDAESFVDGVLLACAAAPRMADLRSQIWPAWSAHRLGEHEEIREAHARIYGG